jgi:hypothetical protein
VLAVSTDDGVNVTAVVVVVSVPATATPDGFTSDRVDFVGSTALVKVTETEVLAATPVAPAAGVVLATTGAGETVLNVQVTGAIAVPAALDAPRVTV